jgi:hypothetical protein
MPATLQGDNDYLRRPGQEQRVPVILDGTTLPADTILTGYMPVAGVESIVCRFKMLTDTGKRYLVEAHWYDDQNGTHELWIDQMFFKSTVELRQVLTPRGPYVRFILVASAYPTDTFTSGDISFLGRVGGAGLHTNGQVLAQGNNGVVGVGATLAVPFEMVTPGPAVFSFWLGGGPFVAEIRATYTGGVTVYPFIRSVTAAEQGYTANVVIPACYCDVAFVNQAAGALSAFWSVIRV